MIMTIASNIQSRLFSGIRLIHDFNKKWRQLHGIHDSSYISALKTIDRITEFIGAPKFVVDLGCGRGQWLAAFKTVTGSKILGFDKKRFRRGYIECNEYKRINLASPKLFQTTAADLAISLEVGEHLPKQSAPFLVMNLCNIAPAVLFSAATPGQGGWRHINEQPHSFWDDLFARRGYRRVTTFDDVVYEECPWYGDNMRLYRRVGP